MNVGLKSKKKLSEVLQNDDSSKNEKRTLYRSLWTTQTELPVLQEAIAEYDIVCQVGKGTFSTVYYALHKNAKDKSARKLASTPEERAPPAAGTQQQQQQQKQQQHTPAAAATARRDATKEKEEEEGEAGVGRGDAAAGAVEQGDAGGGGGVDSGTV